MKALENSERSSTVFHVHREEGSNMILQMMLTRDASWNYRNHHTVQTIHIEMENFCVDCVRNTEKMTMEKNIDPNL